MKSVLSPRPDRASVAHLVETSQKLALAYLIRKRQSGRLQTSLFGLDLDDLALDSIAELFQRRGDGQFSVLKSYFGSDVATRSEDELTVALRRLVFSKVNENLFRRYHEVDGNLSRVVRNVKDGVKVFVRMQTTHRGGQPWITVERGDEPSSSDDEELEIDLQTQKPLAPAEVLESYFTSCLCHVNQVRDLVGLYPDFVDAHPQYLNGYPLVAFSETIRSAFLRVEAGSADARDEERLFTTDEIGRAIDAAASEVMAEKKSGYVGRGKVDGETYEAYFGAVSHVLSAQYLEDPESESFYESLTRFMPELTEEDYMRDHRNVVEYLVKLVRAKLIDFLGSRAA